MATAATKTNVIAQPGLHLKENFAALLEANLEWAKNREWDRKLQGLKFYRQETTNKDHVIRQYHHGIGLVPANRDADNLPLDNAALGFQNTITMVTYRLAMRWERETMEDDQYGVVGPRQAKFLSALNKTIEYHTADGFNNGFGASGSAPFIAADGLYLFDTPRNASHPGVATWSNEETASALTDNSLWTMDQAFADNTDERGHIAPLIMSDIIIPKELERKAFQLARSERTPEDAMNAANYHQGLTYHVWNYLTDVNAWFGFGGDGGFQGPQNELVFIWRVRPNTMTVEVGGNPDVVSQRQRSRWAMGVDLPYAWRGNAGA
jgi:hypothetical protein